MQNAAAPFSDRGMFGFEMSLRDAFRGVASFVDATEDVLEPAAGLVPSPLRRRVKDTYERLKLTADDCLSRLFLDDVLLRLHS